ncbi:Putative pre-16S rRNA nuclease [Dyadobacter sp. CECT 9623]|jgi:putative Holliday junction resolvase|uniref:Putative pre-16S rRNA nuclease n=1 Tax=Dyadobacter linearis TaxID=2823330 RepID=A0ABN7RAD8_9BACT|nr:MULTISPECIES: Holliday junction resolvase RuvX [unclassified Dyadobacter]MCE7062524.1 Holliday junction resolvase RuvX [Dyadobacter sp. CY343]CAG5071703.1 Putative pre-16S rRNA nuclease [Dyadobacter sp. CECT 9623]
MGRLLAIDFGSKRSGIAVTDPLQIIATALDTVATHELRNFLKKYTEKEQLEAFIIGMPKKLDNTASENAARVTAFIKLLQKDFPEIPVHAHDERFTSSMALQSMISGGSKKSDRREKGNIDKISATIILQSFMESRANSKRFL